MWRTRRRAIIPALHRKYIEAMVGMFGDCALHGSRMLDRAAEVCVCVVVVVVVVVGAASGHEGYCKGR